MPNVYRQGVHGDYGSNCMRRRSTNPLDQHIVGKSYGALRILHHNHKLLTPHGPNPNRGNLCNSVECFDCHLDRYGGNRIAIGVNDMNASAFDPQPTLRIDMANVSRAMPHAAIAGSRTSFVLGAPQFVVAV